jgi:hypothetical protein
MNEFILPHVSIKVVDSIIYCKYNEGVELGFPEIIELVSSIENLSSKKPYLIFLDASSIKNITKEGKRMIEKYSHMPFCIGAAIFVRKPRYECAYNFVNSYKTKFPFRAFYSEQEAVDWLMSLSLDC